MNKFLVLIFAMTVFLFSEDLLNLYEEKYLFDQTGGKYTPNIMNLDLKIAEYYQSNHKYEKANDYFIKTIKIQNDSLRLMRQLDYAKNQVYLKKYENALLLLHPLPNSSKDSLVISNVNNLLAQIYLLRGQTNLAYIYTLKGLEYLGLSCDTLELKSILSHKNYPKSVTKARLFSKILPGIGQLYAGDPVESAGALSIMGLWSGIAISSAINGDYFSAIGVLIWPWQRYYRGNLQSAERATIRYNKNIEIKIIKVYSDWINQEVIKKDKK